jgi:hypothetical protein
MVMRNKVEMIIATCRESLGENLENFEGLLASNFRA